MLRTFIFAILNFAFKTFISAKKRKQLEKLLESFIQPLLNPLLIIPRKIKNLIINSGKFRRLASIIFLFVIILSLYPPHTWGTWRRHQSGIASYYGFGFYCKSSASGEIYWPWKYAAAHKTLPIGTIVKVKNRENGKVVYVKIFDRGPFAPGRIIDLTKAAARDLGIVENGLAEVDIYTRASCKSQNQRR
jgi:rare lipoprotein A